MPPASSMIYPEPVFSDKLHKTTLEDIASGKVAYEINLAAKKDTYASSAFEEGFAFYQKIGEDSLPSVDESRGWVVLSGDNYANGEHIDETKPPETTNAPETTQTKATTKAPETTTSPETTMAPETEAPEQGGCGSFSYRAITTVIICAVLITNRAYKKKAKLS